MISYVIKPGDNLYSISQRYNVSIKQILDVNPQIKDPSMLYSGMSIIVPYGTSKAYPVYNILGSTDKLGNAQMKSINDGRNYVVQFARKHPDEVYINGQTNEQRVSITFDDGPDSTVTPAVLDLFKKKNITANFFFLGNQIDFYPNVVRRAYDEGHIILNHSLNHPYFTQLDPHSIKAQVILTEDKIKRIIGKRPAMIRPPHGMVNDNVLSGIRGTNNRIVIWSIDTMDWVKNIEIPNVVGNVLDNVRPGDIILMHSGPGQRTALSALSDIIKGLFEKGYRIVGLGELLNVNPYK